jgi:hypothetical protein
LSFPTSALSDYRELRYGIIVVSSFVLRRNATYTTSVFTVTILPGLTVLQFLDKTTGHTHRRLALSRIADTPSAYLYKMGFRHCDSVDYLSLSTNSTRGGVLFLHKDIRLAVDRLVTVLELFGENTSKTVLLISLYENLLKASFPKTCAMGTGFPQLLHVTSDVYVGWFRLTESDVSTAQIASHRQISLV